LCSLPTDAAVNRYHGAVAQYSQNAQYDETGKLLFFMVDGNIYDQGGYLMGDNDANPNTCRNCLLKGLQEVSIVLVPGTCDKYFIINAESKSFPSQNLSQLAYCILDLSMENPFFPERRGRVLKGNEVYSYPQFYNLVINGGLTTAQVDGQSLFKIIDGNYSLAGPLSGRLVNVKHVVLDGPTGAEPKTVFIQTCSDFAAATITANGIAAPVLLSNYAPNADNYQTFSGQLVVAKGPDGVIRLAGTWNNAFSTSTFAADNTIYVHPLQFSGGVSATALNAINTNVGHVVSQHGKTRGLAFSPNGRYLYFAQQFAPKVGYIDMLDPTFTVHDLGLERGINFSNYGSGRLAVNVNPTYPSKAIYFPRSGGMGWLENPDNPATAIWHTNVTGTTPALATPPSSVLTLTEYGTGITPIPNYLVDAQNHRDQQIPSLELEACCQKNEMIPEWSHDYTYSDINTISTAWTSADNGLTAPIICAPAPDGHVYFEEDFHILPGARLFVNGMDWRFAPNARLIVERGGYIRFTNCILQGTLNEECEPQRWPGVRVEGTATVDQFPSINGDQGNISLNNSIVKDAVVGVWCAREVGGNAVGGYAGGIVQASNSTFKNCITGVKIANYNTFSLLSSFTGTTFVTDTDWPDNLFPYRHADISYTKTVYFNSCSFANDWPSYSVNNGTGVYCFNGQVNVIGGSYLTSYFSNLTLGVANAAGALNASTINHMDFRDNGYGIYDISSRFARYTNNRFSIPDLNGGLNKIGIYVWQSQLYTIEKNIFNGTKQKQGNIGIYFLGYTPGNENTWVYVDNQIYNNSFKSLNIGNGVKYIHRGNAFGEIDAGLSLFCGTYSGNTGDIVLLSQSPVKPNQGFTNQQLSGNRFITPANCTSNWDWNLDPQWNVIPGWAANMTVAVYRNQDPICDVQCEYWTNFSDNQVPGSGIWTAEGTCGNGQLENLQALPEQRAQYDLAKAQLDAANDTYIGHLDGGETPDLMAMFQAEIHPTSSSLRDALLANSPLSDEVLFSMLNCDPPMDPWHITQVLVNNVKLNAGIIETARESGLLSPFYMGFVDDAQAGSGTSWKQLVELEIGQRRTEKANALAALGYMYSTDTLLMHGTDSLKALILADNDPTYTQLRTALQLMEHNWDYAENEVTAAGDGLNGNKNFQDIQSIGSAYNGDWAAMSSGEVEQLREDMLGGEAGAAMAAAILWQIEASSYIPPVEMPNTFTLAQHFAPTTDSMDNEMSPEMTVYPNPVHNEFYLTWPLEHR
ncbi:MAG: hypothetical protein WAT61_08825, partial [Flavobacteriales bacterium]